MNDTTQATKRDVSIRLDDTEIACIHDMTKVDAVAPGAVAVIRKAIELFKAGNWK